MQEDCVLTLKTALPGPTLQRLLTGACMEPYRIASEKVEETPKGERKVLKILFGIPEDRERFRLQLRRLANAVTAPGSEDSPMMSQYEAGMRITYDERSKRVIVAFRGQLLTLPDEFDTEFAAIRAGEAYCRDHGWISKVPPRGAVSKVRMFHL